jgi:hypothetical protein
MKIDNITDNYNNEVNFNDLLGWWVLHMYIIHRLYDNLCQTLQQFVATSSGHFMLKVLLFDNIERLR